MADSRQLTHIFNLERKKEAKDTNYDTPIRYEYVTTHLILATRQKDIESVYEILASNIKTIDSVDSDGRTALSYAIEQDQTSAETKLFPVLLIKYNADILHKSVIPYLYAKLHLAASKATDEKSETLHYYLNLIKNKDKEYKIINNESTSGKTLLTVVLERTDLTFDVIFKIAELLINNGANPEHKSVKEALKKRFLNNINSATPNIDEIKAILNLIDVNEKIEGKPLLVHVIEAGYKNKSKQDTFGDIVEFLVDDKRADQKDSFIQKHYIAMLAQQLGKLPSVEPQLASDLIDRIENIDTPIEESTNTTLLALAYDKFSLSEEKDIARQIAAKLIKKKADTKHPSVKKARNDLIVRAITTSSHDKFKKLIASETPDDKDAKTAVLAQALEKLSTNPTDDQVKNILLLVDQGADISHDSVTNITKTINSILLTLLDALHRLAKTPSKDTTSLGIIENTILEQYKYLRIYDKAVEYAKLAAEHNNDYGMWYLVIIDSQGLIALKEFEKAIYYLEKMYFLFKKDIDHRDVINKLNQIALSSQTESLTRFNALMALSRIYLMADNEPTFKNTQYNEQEGLNKLKEAHAIWEKDLKNSSDEKIFSSKLYKIEAEIAKKSGNTKLANFFYTKSADLGDAIAKEIIAAPGNSKEVKHESKSDAPARTETADSVYENITKVLSGRIISAKIAEIQKIPDDSNKAKAFLKGFAESKDEAYKTALVNLMNSKPTDTPIDELLFDKTQPAPELRNELVKIRKQYFNSCDSKEEVSTLVSLINVLKMQRDNETNEEVRNAILKELISLYVKLLQHKVIKEANRKISYSNLDIYLKDEKIAAEVKANRDGFFTEALKYQNVYHAETKCKDLESKLSTKSTDHIKALLEEYYKNTKDVEITEIIKTELKKLIAITAEKINLGVSDLDVLFEQQPRLRELRRELVEFAIDHLRNKCKVINDNTSYFILNLVVFYGAIWLSSSKYKELYSDIEREEAISKAIESSGTLGSSIDISDDSTRRRCINDLKTGLIGAYNITAPLKQQAERAIHLIRYRLHVIEYKHIPSKDQYIRQQQKNALIPFTKDNILPAVSDLQIIFRNEGKTTRCLYLSMKMLALHKNAKYQNEYPDITLNDEIKDAIIYLTETAHKIDLSKSPDRQDKNYVLAAWYLHLAQNVIPKLEEKSAMHTLLMTDPDAFLLCAIKKCNAGIHPEMLKIIKERHKTGMMNVYDDRKYYQAKKEKAEKHLDTKEEKSALSTSFTSTAASLISGLRNAVTKQRVSAPEKGERKTSSHTTLYPTSPGSTPAPSAPSAYPIMHETSETSHSDSAQPLEAKIIKEIYDSAIKIMFKKDENAKCYDYLLRFQINGSINPPMKETPEYSYLLFAKWLFLLCSSKETNEELKGVTEADFANFMQAAPVKHSAGFKQPDLQIIKHCLHLCGINPAEGISIAKTLSSASESTAEPLTTGNELEPGSSDEGTPNTSASTTPRSPQHRSEGAADMRSLPPAFNPASTASIIRPQTSLGFFTDHRPSSIVTSSTSRSAALRSARNVDG